MRFVIFALNCGQCGCWSRCSHCTRKCFVSNNSNNNNESNNIVVAAAAGATVVASVVEGETTKLCMLCLHFFPPVCQSVCLSFLSFIWLGKFSCCCSCCCPMLPVGCQRVVVICCCCCWSCFWCCCCWRLLSAIHVRTMQTFAWHLLTLCKWGFEFQTNYLIIVAFKLRWYKASICG